MIHHKWKSKIISALLTIAMVFMLWPGAAYAANPTIQNSNVFDNNSGIIVNFSEGIYTGLDEANKGTGAVTAEDFTLTFIQNAGTATGVTITSLKSASGNELLGGETSIMFCFTPTGVPNGKETIEIKIKDGTSVYNAAGEAMAAGQTTGAKYLYDKLPPDFFTGYPKAGAVQAAGSKQVEILVKAYEAVSAYYVVVDSGSTPSPSASAVKLGNNAAGTPALASGQDIALTGHEEKSIVSSTLPADNSSYDVYVVIKDANNNTTVNPVKVTVTTPEEPVKVASITVTGTDGAETMKNYREGGSLKMLAAVFPEDAANKDVAWSVAGKGNSWLEAAEGEIGAGFAYIDPITGNMNQGYTVGLVTVKATAKDGSEVFGEKDITITGVHMSFGGISTLAGKTYTLKATPVPALTGEQTITWASSDETVATVDQSGNITAVAQGSADITATTTDGRQGICSITVDKSPSNYITAFSFPQQSDPANIDGISQVEIAVAEDTDVSELVASFTLSEKSWATVNDIPQESGVTVNDFTNPVVYKVTAENGDVRDWTVTVTKPFVPVSTITVSAAGGAVTVVKGNTLQMSAEVQPVFANNKTVSWSVLNGTGTASIDASGLVTAESAGTVTVTAAANDGSDTAGSIVITIKSRSSSGGSGGGESSSATAGTSINDSGGTVNDKGVTVDIPGHAVDATIRITIARISNSSISVPEDLQLVSEIFDIAKDKSSDFKRAVTVTLPFNRNAVDRDRDELGLYWWNGTGWDILDNINVDWSSGTVSATVNHFTKFAILAASKTVPEPENPVIPIQSPQEIIFNDISGHWAQASIKNLAAAGVLSGYPDDSFKPEQSITRAEFAAVLVKAFQLPVSNGKIFDDTSGHWAQDAIASAYASGIISGYNDSSFGPNDPITREQMAVMVVKAARLSNVSDAQNFIDSETISSWAQEAVVTACTRQLISGYPDNTFKPQNQATRAEAVAVLSRALNNK